MAQLCINCNKRESSHRPDGPASDCYPGYEAPPLEDSGAPLSPEDGGSVEPAPAASGEVAPSRRRRTRKPKLIPGPIKLPAQDAKRVKIILTGGIKGGSEAAYLLSENSGLGFWLSDDRFQPEETVMLVEGVYSVLETFPTFLLWLAETSAQGVWLQLGVILAMVAAPRLARHGIIPPEIAAIISFAPFFMASGGAPNDSGGNGNGQVHPTSVSNETATIPGGIPFQTGRSGMADTADYPLSEPPY